jgi:homoprotocatechuate degradation regulator HpaR
MSLIQTRIRHRNLPLLLLQVRERVISHFRPILNAYGITEQQWRVVRVLLDAPVLEPREIGELCSISSPSLVGVLSRMEQLGFVKRRRDAGDQRRVRVSATPRARALAARMAPQIEATYRHLESISGEKVMNRLEEMLDGALSVLPSADDAALDATEMDGAVSSVPPQTRSKRASR